MVYFTADLHFYHENIIRHTNRNYSNAKEMNNDLIKKWNEKVKYSDEVYILGDFTMKGAELASEILYQLKGKKHLIRGNHDNFVDSAEFDKSLFASIQYYAEIVYSNVELILFHYPILEWKGMLKGSIALHGHQHNGQYYNYRNLQNKILRYDVGVGANNMSPVSAEEIINFFSMI